MEILNYQVSDGQSGIRIDRYLSEMNEELSRSYIQKLLKRAENNRQWFCCKSQLQSSGRR